MPLIFFLCSFNFWRKWDEPRGFLHLSSCRYSRTFRALCQYTIYSGFVILSDFPLLLFDNSAEVSLYSWIWRSGWVAGWLFLKRHKRLGTKAQYTAWASLVVRLCSGDTWLVETLMWFGPRIFHCFCRTSALASHCHFGVRAFYSFSHSHCKLIHNLLFSCRPRSFVFA